MEKKIRDIIETQINPKLSEHLGGLEFRNYEDGILLIRFTGACRSCYASEDTMANLVEPVLRQSFPEIKEILIDQSVDEDMLAMARKILNKEI